MRPGPREEIGHPRLVDRLQQKDKTVSDWLDEWYAGLKMAENTMRSYGSICTAIKLEIGDHAISRLTVQDTAKALDTIRETRGARTAQSARPVMTTAFNKAISKGHMTHNPAVVTEPRRSS